MTEEGQLPFPDSDVPTPEPPRQKIIPTIETFADNLEIYFGKVFRYNEFSEQAEYLSRQTGKWEPWSDAQDATLRMWFEHNLGISNRNKLDDALRVFLSLHKVNPLTDMLDALEWDGLDRIERFATFAMGADDTPYSRQVSRILFAGGVNRAYRPGCKFDDMVVLMSDQGGGKSTIIRWLNMNDDFFEEIKTIEGKEAVEQIQGSWICEMAELMAMTKVKDTESVKAFITRQQESYRVPYERHKKRIPRRCIFVGTTNNERFLTDKTGNRRFYPIKCNSDGYDNGDREKEIRDYIRQCWAEAVHKFKSGDRFMQSYARREMLSDIRAAQEAATEEDYREGVIRDWLASKPAGYRTCVLQVWTEAMEMDSADRPCKPSRAEGIIIDQIISHTKGWRWTGKVHKFGDKYGTQKYYEKQCDTPQPVKAPDDMPF